jgi:hypothetical protein
MADRTTTSGRLPTVAGLTTVAGGALREPRRFDDPLTFEVAPSNVRRSRATRIMVEQKHG